jgi:uncharacterized membrane-anchored protein YhcB (DUF1043 family)
MKEFLDIAKIQHLFLHIPSVQLTDLDSKVQAALIAACASIVVSILSALFSARQTQKSQDRSRAAQMDLERFKLELTSQHKTVEEQRKSILEFIESIQGLKDDIRKIVQDNFEGLDSKTACKKISSSSNKLIECYQKNQEYLESERVLLHDAKNQAMCPVGATKVARMLAGR